MCPDPVAMCYLPVDFSIVLPAPEEIGMQLDASKCTLLPSDGTDETDRPMHAAGHVDGVANIEVVLRGGGRSPAWGHGRHLGRVLVVQNRQEGVVVAVIRYGGKGARGQCCLRSFARKKACSGGS